MDFATFFNTFCKWAQNMIEHKTEESHQEDVPLAVEAGDDMDKSCELLTKGLNDSIHPSLFDLDEYRYV